MNDIAFPLYFNWVDIMSRRLTKSEMSTAVAALTDYFRTGAVDYGALSPKLAYGIEFMVAQIEFMKEKKEKMSAAGKKGATRSRDAQTDGGQRSAEEGTVGQRSAKVGGPPANTNNNKKKKTKTNNSSVKKKDVPNMIELNTFVATEKLNMDPEEFFSYYESVGWVDGKGNPIVDWRARAIAWARNKAAKTGEPARVFDYPEEREEYSEYEREKYKEEWRKYREKTEKEGPGYDVVFSDRAYAEKVRRERGGGDEDTQERVSV